MSVSVVVQNKKLKIFKKSRSPAGARPQNSGLIPEKVLLSRSRLEGQSRIPGPDFFKTPGTTDYRLTVQLLELAWLAHEYL
jgi:hypothetical protein